MLNVFSFSSDVVILIKYVELTSTRDYNQWVPLLHDSYLSYSTIEETTQTTEAAV